MTYHPYHFVGEVLLHHVYIARLKQFCQENRENEHAWWYRILNIAVTLIKCLHGTSSFEPVN